MKGNFHTPKELFISDEYKGLGMAEKQLYAILLDRLHYDMQYDEYGSPCISCSVKELSDLCGASVRSIIRYKQRLNEFGLISETKQGQGKLNNIYLYKA